jgi:hypothetical protein
MEVNITVNPESQVSVISQFVSDLQNNKIKFSIDEYGKIKVDWKPDFIGNFVQNH